ncbi:protein of unknown function [Candidatus Promineifilum breve]|uniref:SH3b domain-containing protein n=1 Tax=Candidatus Promineifilum breve TaxID=1806508 RepID=A0A160SXT9_9CHLR|nr:SH3 domain-containing protein [Candidatus Promineifilum breve]CUS02171.2 protein of unknown function [Candidatus Promineifilum breve]
MAKKVNESGRREQSDARPVPWLWLGLGSLVTVIGLGLLAWLLGNYLVQPPAEVAAGVPTIIRLTAPVVPTATQSVNPATPTVAPTATTAATPDLSVAPPEITVGYYAEVVETGGVGVTVRNGPNTSNLPVTVAGEGSAVLVLEGPTPGGEYQWWRIRLPDGTEGWAAGDFLVPAAQP